jgi:membrane protein YdbS with pleckstrin-like domain
MHCPKCGEEATEQSVYCHKCGERLDLPDEEGLPEDPGAALPGSQPAPSAETPAQTATTPAERFQETVAASQGREDEPEEELWQGSYSSRAMIGWWGLGGLITIALAVLAFWAGRSWVYWLVLIAVVLLWLYQFFLMKYRQWNVRYRLTNQRFIHETGILRRVTDRIEVIDMDDITFEQRLLERFVGVGTIHISSSDRTHPELELRGIENVKEVSEELDDTRRAERRRRGLHIEAI